MTRLRLASVVLALALATLPAVAQTPTEPILQTDAHYISGQPGFKKEMWEGQIVLGFDVLTYTQQRPKNWVATKQVPRFSIPLSRITKASNTIDTGINGGAVAAFGIWGLAAKRQDEYVFITTETDTSTDVVIFQVKKNTSAATAAKIMFAAKKAKEAGGAR